MRGALVGSLALICGWANVLCAQSSLPVYPPTVAAPQPPRVSGVFRVLAPQDPALPMPPQGTGPATDVTAPALIPAHEGDPWLASPAGEPGLPPRLGDLAGRANEASAYPYIMWARGEYLAWWVKNGPAPPPLVTTGPADAARPALLGQPGTAVLFGNTPLDYQAFAGGRFTVGSWCVAPASWGIEVSALVLEQRTRFFGATSDATGVPVIGRPFIDGQAGQEQVLFATFPGFFAGGVAVSAPSRLWGLEVNLLDCVLHDGQLLPLPRSPYGAWRLELQAGCRYLDLREDITIDQVSNVLAAGNANFINTTVTAPSALVLEDAFATHNQFFGGQLGARLEWVHGNLFVDSTVKLAVGATHEVLDVHGQTTLVLPAASFTGPTTVPGGLLATSTNSGRRGHERVAVVPELGVTIGYQCGPYVRLLGGYNFLAWSRVVRPGDQIDRAVNLTQVPIAPTPPAFGPLVGPARPAALFRESDFWAQGITGGLEIRF